MTHETSQYINNMIKKKIDLCFVHDEISGQMTHEFNAIKYIKRITLYLISIPYTAPHHVHTIKTITH